MWNIWCDFLFRRNRPMNSKYFIIMENKFKILFVLDDIK